MARDGAWQIHRSDWQWLLREARALKVLGLRDAPRRILLVALALAAAAIVFGMVTGPEPWREDLVGLAFFLSFVAVGAAALAAYWLALDRWVRVLSKGRSDGIFEELNVTRQGGLWMMARGPWQIRVPSEAVVLQGHDVRVTLGRASVVLRRDPLAWLA